MLYFVRNHHAKFFTTKDGRQRDGVTVWAFDGGLEFCFSGVDQEGFLVTSPIQKLNFGDEVNVSLNRKHDPQSAISIAGITREGVWVLKIGVRAKNEN